jgi:hypothetical protein
MTILRSTLGLLGRLLGVRDDQIEDALASERLVKRTLSRRGLFQGVTAAVVAAALPKGIVFGEVRSSALVCTIYDYHKMILIMHEVISETDHMRRSLTYALGEDSVRVVVT